jgi:hypothetical protein
MDRDAASASGQTAKPMLASTATQTSFKLAC